MKTNKNLPNIFDYNDFRKYLNEYQIARYSFDRTFTMRMMLFYISVLLN